MRAGETTILRLLQGSKVFLIPNFQRRYTWRAKEWELLRADLLREYAVEHPEDPQNLDGHFLGSIVLHPAAGRASLLMRHLVIDGQQRLTTILVLLAAIRDVRSQMQPHWDPAEYNVKYLTNPFDPEYPDRLRPTELDRAAYTLTMRDGQPTEGIGQAYTFFIQKIRHVVDANGVDIEKLANTLLMHMLVVEIITGTGDSVNNILNTLNSKGMPLAGSDLVRNELLLHVGDEAGKDAYEKYWVPMEKALVASSKTGWNDRQFITFLWSREVAEDPSATRQDLFSVFENRLRRSLDHLSIAERQSAALQVFEDIYEDHRLFLLVRDPQDPSTEALGVGEELRESLERLRRWGSEPSTPLALWLLKQTRTGALDETDAVACLDILLGYLIRRALVGIPTNTLNRLITPLPSRLAARRGQGRMQDELAALLSAQGYYWPTNNEVLKAVITQPIYVSARRQVHFLLSEAERLMSTKELALTSRMTIDHVMPQELSDDWRRDLRDADVELDDALALTHTLGNLTLTGLNSEMSNSSFSEKRRHYASSPVRMNEELSRLRTFFPDDIRARTHALARRLLTRYPGPQSSPSAVHVERVETMDLPRAVWKPRCSRSRRAAGPRTRTSSPSQASI